MCDLCIQQRSNQYQKICIQTNQKEGGTQPKEYVDKGSEQMPHQQGKRN